MNIVLLEPEIPANTGNIGRTCVSTGTKLHLIRPLGFSLAEKELKRAGLDYWPRLDVTVYEDWDDFRGKHPGAAVWMATTKARQLYTEAHYGPDDFLLFGKESAGIPEELLVRDPARCVRIPMAGTCYLISRPLSEERFEAWLKARTKRGVGPRSETVLTLLH